MKPMIDILMPLFEHQMRTLIGFSPASFSHSKSSILSALLSITFFNH